MSKLFHDLERGISGAYDFRTDYRFPESLNGKSLEEIRDYAVEFISRVPNTVVLFAEKPYGQGAAYFYNREDPESTNEVVYSCSEDMRLNMGEIVKYLNKDKDQKEIRRLRLYLFVGENGAYSQLPIKKLRRLSREGKLNEYADGKTIMLLSEEGYFANFTEEGYYDGFAKMAAKEEPTATQESAAAVE